MQLPHPMLPDRPHDHAARQDFIETLRLELTGRLSAGNRTVFSARAADGFVRRTGKAPATRRDVRQAMLRDPYHQAWSSLMRSTQEMLFGEVGDWANHVPQAPSRRHAGGTLTLAPELELPPYLTTVDIHCMPGGYFADDQHGGMTTGLVYDRAVYLYMMGRLGPKNDACGTIIAAWIKRDFPTIKPRRILDMGCGVGHSTLPYAAAFPKADIHGIDVAGPMVRYAHARAEAMGITAHFTQANAEHTSFPDGHFDLVLSHIMLHETSSNALRNVFAEGRRLLAPGGLMLHAEGTGFANKPLIDQYLADWDTHFNGEPFIGTLHDTDLRKVLRNAGFATDEIVHTYSAEGHSRHAGGGLLLIGGNRKA